MEITIKGLPQKVLGSPAYQVANMDILNASILNVKMFKIFFIKFQGISHF